MEFRATEIGRKKGFLIDKEEIVDASEREIKMQKNNF
jgi:hypothetical protein